MPKQRIGSFDHQNETLVCVLNRVMDELRSLHPDIACRSESRRVAERAIQDLMSKGQRDPLVLVSFARARAATSIRIRISCDPTGDG